MDGAFVWREVQASAGQLLDDERLERTRVLLETRYDEPWTVEALAALACMSREHVLMKIGSGPMMDDATAEQLRTMVKKGVLGSGVFAVEDCQKTYDDLSAKGVEFRYPPKDMPYGIETMMKDPFGNWFSVTQHG